jgi:cell division protein FtsA
VGTEGELKVLGTGLVPSQGVLKGRVEDTEEVRAAVRSSLAEAKRYIGGHVISGAYVSVTGSHITCLNTKDVLSNPGDPGSITPHQLQELVRSTLPEIGPTQEILHVIPIGYEVDGLGGVRNPQGLHASQVKVESHVVLGDAVTLKNTVRVVEACNISVKSLVLQSVASAEAALTGDEREMGVVLADIGGGTCNIAIFRQGSPWYTAVIPVGGDQLTRDLSVAMQVPFYLAEELKVKWGHAMPESIKADEEVIVPSFQGQGRRVVRRRILCEPLRVRLVEMLALIVQRVRQAGLRQMPPGGLVLTGGCAAMPGLRELAQKTLGDPVRIAYPLGIAGLPPQLKKPAFSTSVGVLLWGIKHQGEKRPYRDGQESRWRYKSLVNPFKRVKENAQSTAAVTQNT